MLSGHVCSWHHVASAVRATTSGEAVGCFGHSDVRVAAVGIAAFVERGDDGPVVAVVG